MEYVIHLESKGLPGCNDFGEGELEIRVKADNDDEARTIARSMARRIVDRTGEKVAHSFEKAA